jgi:hypothetical protein
VMQSLQSLYAYGRAFDIGLIAAAAAAAVAAVLCVGSAVLPARWARWQRRRTERRYVRAGMRELERYLTRAATTPARRRPGPPGPGRWPGAGR